MTTESEPRSPPDLDQVAEGLESVHQRLDENHAALVANREEWRALILEMCRLYAEGRALHPSNEAFSQWLAETGLTAKLNKDDRACAIAMGGDLELTKEVLARSTSRSIRLLYAHDWRLRSDAKTAQKPAESKAKGESQPGAGPKPGAKPSHGPRKRRRSGGSSENTRSKSGSEYFTFGRDDPRFDHVGRYRCEIFSEQEYLLIRSCLHPDWCTDPTQKARYTQAFQLFTSREEEILGYTRKPNPESARSRSSGTQPSA